MRQYCMQLVLLDRPEPAVYSDIEHADRIIHFMFKILTGRLIYENISRGYYHM